jgi:hypothetical protein
MPREIEIKLAKPLMGHGGPITKVIVREPTYAEYMQHGDPFLVALSPESKIPFAVEDKVALARYAEILVKSPDALILEQGGMELARKITAAVRSFFQDGAEAGEASETLPTSSSSPPDKAATRSAA